jgi:hypothetical protein
MLLLIGAFLACAGCATRESDSDGLRAKTERSLRGVWQSREFATSDEEFASYTNLTVYIYRIGKFRSDTNNPVVAEVLGAFVYKGRDGKELLRYPVELARGNRIRVGGFMEGIWPRYALKNGSLVLEIEGRTYQMANRPERHTYYYRAVLDKVTDNPGDPERLLPPWVLRTQEDYQ